MTDDIVNLALDKSLLSCAGVYLVPTVTLDGVWRSALTEQTRDLEENLLRGGFNVVLCVDGTDKQ